MFGCIKVVVLSLLLFLVLFAAGVLEEAVLLGLLLGLSYAGYRRVRGVAY